MVNPPPRVPPAVAIVGRKNSGKTTLVVALAAELKRRGYRVASLKHGHHDFEVDEPGRDTWRHFHEGGVEAVVMASASKVALVMRFDDAEPNPRELIRRFYAGRGYDLVLVEGYKRGPFPQIEVFRSALHAHPIHDPTTARTVTAGDAEPSPDSRMIDRGPEGMKVSSDSSHSVENPDADDVTPASDSAGACIATVTDAAEFRAPWPVITLDGGDRLAGVHVARVADLIERRFLGGCDAG